MTVTKTPIVISTISDLAESGMTLGLYCLACDRWGEIIPQAWLDAGKPDVDYVEQKFKCSKCGGKADKQVRSSPRGFSVKSAYKGMERSPN
jgi:hypothetical protein